MNDAEDLRSWTGNMDELARKVAELLGASGAEDADPPSVRLVRDYLQRGLLGQTLRSVDQHWNPGRSLVNCKPSKPWMAGMSDGDDPGFGALKDKQRSLRSGFSEPLGLRVHRALSWYGRSAQSTDDNDIRFILLWVCPASDNLRTLGA